MAEADDTFFAAGLAAVFFAAGLAAGAAFFAAGLGAALVAAGLAAGFLAGAAAFLGATFSLLALDFWYDQRSFQVYWVRRRCISRKRW